MPSNLRPVACTGTPLAKSLGGVRQDRVRLGQRYQGPIPLRDPRSSSRWLLLRPSDKTKAAPVGTDSPCGDDAALCDADEAESPSLNARFRAAVAAVFVEDLTS
jgi:hypothetical protein